MKRSALPARYRAANKAQENPHGALVVFILFVLLFLLSSRSVLASPQNDLQGQRPNIQFQRWPLYPW